MYWKGNEEWNYSAPHGAGRLMSRTVAKIPLQFLSSKTNEGIYTTSVNAELLMNVLWHIRRLRIL